MRGKKCTFVLENAGDASYPEGWEDYKTVASYDREDWFRIASTEYKDGALSWTLTPERDSVWFAYFAPYSYERHLDLIARCASAASSATLRL